ncbi:DUF2637 domain-containing protein, partial [Streptomyces sp. NPDC000983]|uniref:DUF2637 domain-containing protein n=1 Tax=Streptomyces sp. NPDC000983 TaxID=3154373 RepID=UPI00332E2385
MTRRPTPAQDDTRPSTGQTPPRAHRALVAVIASATLLIAGIGFAGSYAAVRELALKKGFGNFSYVFPI